MKERQFRFRGKSYKIFIRPDAPHGPYYIHFQVRGMRIKRCLNSRCASVAIKAAKKIIADEQSRPAHEQREKAAPVTIGDIISLYSTRASLARRTVRNNILALRLILRTVLGSDRDATPVSVLDARLVREFQSRFVKRYVALAGTDADARLARERALRSSRSFIQQARSIFARSLDWPGYYSRAGFPLPKSIEEFMTTPLEGRIGGTTYSAPDDAVVKRTFELFASDEQVGQNSYLAFWLALGAGLRRSEISNLQWQHIVMRAGQAWVCGGVGKDGQRVEVPIQQAAWNAIAPYKRETGFVISERGLGWAKRLSAQLASCGWTARKRLHELRAYIGSLLYQAEPVAAMRFLRHKSIRTTEQFYVRHFSGTRMPEVLPCVPPPKAEDSPRR